MARDIADERVDDASQVLKVGQQVEAKFVGMDRKGRSLLVLALITLPAFSLGMPRKDGAPAPTPR